MKLSSSTLLTVRLGWLIGASISLLFNGNFGYTLSSQTLSGDYVTYLIWGTTAIFGGLDIFKNRLGGVFARLLSVGNKKKAAFAILLYLVIYGGAIGLSGVSTVNFFTNKANEAKEKETVAHIEKRKLTDDYKAQVNNLVGLKITYDADLRTYKNIVNRNNDRRALNKAPLEKEETEKKNKLEISQKAYAAGDALLNKIAREGLELTWFAANGSSLGMYFMVGLELLVFFCGFAIVLIQEDDAVKVAQETAQTDTDAAQKTNEAVQSETEKPSDTAPVPPSDDTEAVQLDDEAAQEEVVPQSIAEQIDTRQVITKEELIVLLEKEIVPMSARTISKKYQFSASAAQRIIAKIRKAKAQEQAKQKDVQTASTLKNDIPSSNIILLPNYK